MSNENQFWQGALAAANPGWDIGLAANFRGGAGALASNDVFLYLVDVATGWVGGRAMHSSEAPVLARSCQPTIAARRRILNHNPINAADLAAESIAECGAAQVETTSPELDAATRLVVAALRETVTFEHAAADNQQRGEADMAGHWIYFSYRTKERNGVVNRPLWISTASPRIGRAGRFLDAEVLQALVQHVVRDETTCTHSAVGKALASMGGAIVAPGLLEAF